MSYLRIGLLHAVCLINEMTQDDELFTYVAGFFPFLCFFPSSYSSFSSFFFVIRLFFLHSFFATMDDFQAFKVSGILYLADSNYKLDSAQ